MMDGLAASPRRLSTDQVRGKLSAPHTVSHMFGEIVWLMTQSPLHRHFALAVPRLRARECTYLEGSILGPFGGAHRGRF
jgi:hemolysin-activating ACP:hemolysin acyltransferase